MGGFDFEWDGKVYSVITEGGYPFFDDDEVEEAFEKWRATEEGIRAFGPVPTDWSKEHYLDDKYPFDPDRECRVDAEDYGKGTDDDDDDGYYEEPYIDWCSYEKCRYGCYRQFYLTSEAHVCGKCGVHSCKECARGSFKKCSGGGCDEWVCGKHAKCGEHGSKRSKK